MNTVALDPLIHHPGRLRIVAALAALPDGNTLSVTRLRGMIGLPVGGPIAGLQELDRGGYVRTEKARGDAAPATAVLTGAGRAALEHYTAVLSQFSPMTGEDHEAPAPWMRAGDADRDAAAAALGEHFALGRLTLDELNARLDATLTATTHGELSRASTGLPDLTVLWAPVSFLRGKRPISRHKPGPVPGRGPRPRRRCRTRGRSS
jgi:hypothetical protein